MLNGNILVFPGMFSENTFNFDKSTILTRYCSYCDNTAQFSDLKALVGLKGAVRHGVIRKEVLKTSRNRSWLLLYRRRIMGEGVSHDCW
jgi:hypothetical protein